MSLGVNTNVSSLTAQRALASADKELSTSMERLSTGKRINTASDDAAGMAVATRLTAQINGLNAAVKNANSAIALTQTIDGALDEVTDMLQRARELSVQSASATVSASDRIFIQDEITQLMSEIDRISSSTQYNGQKVLDGTFTGDLQIGANGGETMSLSVASSAASAIGNYKITGDVIKEVGSTSGNANVTDAADDIIITGTASSTIDVATGDSAKQVAAKINAVTGSTGVSAEAKTQALIYTDMVAAQSFTLKINGTATASFSITSSDVSAGVTAINNISATTGVTAEATDANRIKLVSADGSDILVENESTNTNLRAKNLKFDGSEITPIAAYTVKQDTNVLASSTAHVFSNNSTGVETSFTTTSAATLATTMEAGINTALSLNAGTTAIRETTLTAATLGAGDYYLSHTSTGNVYKISVSTATVAGWQTAVGSAEYYGGSFDGETVNLSASNEGKLITVYNAGASTASGKVGIQGSRHFGDFEIYSDSALTVSISDGNRSKTGVEATGVGVYFEDDAAAGTNVGATLAAANTYTAGEDFTPANVAPTTGDGAAKVSIDFFDLSTTAANTVSDATFTITGTDRSGNAIRETVSTDSAFVIAQGASGYSSNLVSKLDFATVSAIDDVTINATAGFKFNIGYLDKSGATTNFVGARTLGDFDIDTGGTTVFNSTQVTGDLDTSDTAFTASSVTSNDTMTFQGGIELTSTDSFSVTQSSTELGTAATNDNYLTSTTAALNAASSVSLTTAAGAEAAIKTIDGAIEKVAAMRSSLGAVENRLEHTVDNLMNVSENSAAARAALTDADFSVESANLAKAQVLLQAGTAMLAQANAAPQMVLQLLQ